MKATNTMITQTLATWIAGLRHDDIPDPVRTALRHLALDTFGVALTGREQPWTEAIRAWARAGGVPETGKARLWGEAMPRLRAADAALVNGAAAHAFELDDFHNAKVHPGAVIVPAAFAVGEAIGAPPERIETAIAAGYEVMIRTSLALKPAHARLKGWHLTAVCGPLGAAAAASVLLGLDAQRTSWALGLAGTQSGGLFAFTADGTDSKRLHPGRAAHAGILAAEMAALGLSGPTCIYEAADGGLLKAFSDEADAQVLVADLGQYWHAADTNFKPYACCGSAHAHVDAALALRGRWQRGGRVRAGMARVIDVQCGYDYQPGSALNAQMSARYCIAIALLDGAVQPAQFEPARVADPAVVDLAARIEIVRDSEHDRLYPGHFCGWVEVETGADRFERVDVLDPSGSPRNLGRNSSIRAKFDALAGSVLPAQRVAGLQEAFQQMYKIPLSTILDLGITDNRCASNINKKS
jgi:2-methylcitrate dehydratase PrpD